MGFAVPAQDSPQGTAAAPKCIFTSAQMVPTCSGTHWNAPVGDPVGLCQGNLQIVLKQNFLLGKKRRGDGRHKCAVLPAPGCNLLCVTRLGLQWH